MRIVHLSDFHITSSGIKDTEGFILKALIEDLKEYNIDKKIDYICFTGDLIDKGGRSFKSIEDGFNQFEEIVITPILNSLGLTKDRFIFVPGNHDIDRNADSIHTETGLRATLHDVISVSNFIDKNDNEGIKRILPFKDFERSFHKETSTEITNFQSTYRYIFDDRQIGVTAFNTAWRCYDSDNDNKNIVLGIRQVTEANKKIENCEFKVALMHHQFDFLKPFDMEIVQPYIQRQYNLILCGHVHKGSNYSKTSIHGNVLVSVAPSNTSDNIFNNDQRELNGYCIIDYDFNTEVYTVHNRKYSQIHARFIGNNELGPDSNGVVEYQGKINTNTPYLVKKRNEVAVTETETLKSNTNDLSIGDSTNQKYNSDFAIENIQVKNNKSNHNFYKSVKLLEKHANNIFNQSDKYCTLVNHLDISVIMMDRLIFLFGEDEKKVLISKINAFHEIMEVFEKDKDSKHSELIHIFALVELWLVKIMNSDVNPDLSELSDIDEIYNYMINMTETSDDFIKVLLLSAKSTLSNIRHNQLDRLAMKSDLGLISEIIISLIFPICTRLEYFREQCIGIKMSDIVPNDIADLNESIKNEYTTNLFFAKGREKEVAELTESVTTTNYTIITGSKGVGKSTVISMFLKNFQEHKNSVLLFSFKHSTNIADFVRSIVEQCNALIINKINTVELHDYCNNYTNIQLSDEGYGTSTSKFEVYSTYFAESIKRTIEECGILYMFIDSFEVIDQQGKDISKLLYDLPVKCKLIISTGENDSAVNWIFEEKKVIEIHNFSRNEMSILTNLDDSDEQNKIINDKLYSKTNGQTAKIINFLNMEDTKKYGINSDIIDDFDDSDIILYQEQLQQHTDNEMLEDLLLLLSIFEPIQPISLEYIQRLLHYKNIKSRLPRIRSELLKIKNQISEIRFNRIKLINTNFAKFITDKYFSKKDIKDFTILILNWMSSDADLRIDFICEFIKNVNLTNFTDVNFENLMNIFMETLKSENNSARLFKIGYSLFNDTGENINIGLRFMEMSQEMGNVDAIFYLGYVYYTGEKVEINLSEAERYLRLGIEIGDARCKGVLGGLLLDGIHIQKNILEGQKLIEESVQQGNKTAKAELANRLFMGDGFKQDIERAKNLFDDLVQEENLNALRIMGNRYLYGQGVTRDEVNGRKLLSIAIEKGSKLAKLSLAKFMISVSEFEKAEGIKYLEELISDNHLESKKYYSYLLLRGIHINKDITRGLSLLIEITEMGNDDDLLEYAEILLNGSLIPQDISKGKLLLEELVEKNHAPSISFLGDLIIDGQHYEEETIKGIALIEKAVILGDVDSIRKLAVRYGYGIGIQKDMDKSIKLFHEAIEKGNGYAKYQLARLILESKVSTNDDIKYAIDLLHEAELLGNRSARNYLGVLYIDGELIERQVDVGLSYLNTSIMMADSHAMRELGYRLIQGENIPEDKYRGEELLKKAIRLGDILAKTILGHVILNGESYTKDINLGIQLLEEAVEAEDIAASRILGYSLVKGVVVEKNKKRGEELLRYAMAKEDSRATMILSEMLIQGSFLSKNVPEGLELLQNLVDKEYESALIQLSEYLIEGIVINKDVNKGIKMLKELSESNLEAKHNYAYYLITGSDGVPKDVNRGSMLLREAEKNGHEDSRRLLANLLVEEVIDQQTDQEGIELFEKAVINNDYLAMSMLGNIYLNGIRVQRNINKAIELFEQSVIGKNLEAKIRYAMILLDNELIPNDINRAIKLLELASKNGSLDARNELAKIYLQGKFVSGEKQKGLYILEQLIEDGNYRAIQYFALMKIYGFEVERNVQLGIDLLDKLVEYGYDSAIMLYANLLIDGVYLPKDASKGERLLKRLTQKGDIEANYNLAIRYLNGDGLRKRVSTGIARLEKAVDLQYEIAMLEYGIRLKKGMRVTKNETKGKEYIEKALKNTDGHMLLNFGINAYNLSDFELAKKFLLRSIDVGIKSAGTSLAYMIRRNEVKVNEPSLNIYNLLQRGLYENDTTSIINLALSLVKNEDSNEAWVMADTIIKSLGNCSMSIDWWVNISMQDDVEGHLVIGWLTKNKKVEDPMGYSSKVRLSKVKSKEYIIPEWLIDQEIEPGLAVEYV